MKKSILIVCLGFISLDMLAQGSDSPLSLSLAGEWNVTLGDAKEVKHAMLPGTIDTNHLGFAPSDTTETTHLTRLYAYKGKVFNVEPPFFVDLVVTDTDPGFAGNTATNATKPATLETGAEVKVPLFIEPGEKIQIDTRTGEYLSRSK